MAESSASDNFMWIPDSEVVGETSDSVFTKKKAFEINHFSFGASCSESVLGKNGAPPTAGKAAFNQVSVDKVVDFASVSLYKACTQGTIFPTIMLVVRRAGGDPLLYLQYCLRVTQVVGLTWDGGSGTERVKETLSISFKAMGMFYIKQSIAGGTNATKTWSWSTIKQGAPSLEIDDVPDPPTPVFIMGRLT